jgi:protein tyrosine kinase modulator
MPRPALKLHPLSYVRMLWKHKALALVTWLVLSGIALVGVKFVPDVYRSESLIIVDSQKIPERFVSSTVQVTLQDHLATLSQQILSSTQLEKIIEKFDLYPKLRKTRSPEQVISLLRDEIQITPEKGWGDERGASKTTGAFRVAYEGPNPTVVAGVVSEISGLFIAENLRTREQRAEGTSEFIESQLDEARKSLEKQEANLSRFKKERMGELPEQEAALIGTLNRLHSELQGTQDAINRAEQNKMMLENTLRLAETAEDAVKRTLQQPPAPRPAVGVVRSDLTPATSSAPAPVRASQVLKERLEALRLRYQDEHPEIKRLKLELEAALKQEAKEAAAAAALPKAPPTVSTSKESIPVPVVAQGGDPVVSAQMLAEWNRERERVATTRTQLAVAAKELGSRVAERERILRSITEYQGKLERLPMREQELAGVTRDYENSKQNYKSLLDKKTSAEMATEMERRQQSERFTLVDPARIPSKPIKPKRLVLNLGAVGGALALSLVLVLGIEFRKNCFLGEWELPATIPVLGRVPTIVIEMGTPVSSRGGS